MAGRKQILYHCTTTENAIKIREEGLKRQNKPWVYLSENPLSWWKYGLVVLPIRITGLNGEMRTFLPESDEILYFGDIEPGKSIHMIMLFLVECYKKHIKNIKKNYRIIVGDE